jgi:gamma-glutamyltranspeptidase/glutathione hydrolase/leukotriene-C4 hydrolase
VANLTSEELALSTYSKINDTYTVNNATFYGGEFWSPRDAGTSHTSVLAPNGDAVSVTSTINLQSVELIF